MRRGIPQGLGSVSTTGRGPCLILHPKGINFSFPWGGYGFILSRGAIANLIRPVYCNSTETSDDFEKNVCSRLMDDILGQRPFFPGRYERPHGSSRGKINLFKDYDTKNWSYCLHGDWVVGYYVNFYYIASHTEDPRYENVTEFRIDDRLGGIRKKKDKDNKSQQNKVETCSETAHVCHRQTPESMLPLTEQIAASSSRRFQEFVIKR